MDWWDADYSLEEKRRTLKTSWQVHKTLGTKAAVEMAASAVYPETRVREWFEYGGEPYRFRLDVDLPEDEWTPEKHKRLMWRMQYYKNLRSHLESVVYRMKPVILENRQAFWFGVLYTHLRVSNYGQEIIRLDGRRRLDGSWLLNQGLIRGPALYQFTVWTRAGNRSKLFALVKVRAEAGRAGSVHVGGTYRAKGTIRHRAGLPAVVVRTGAANRFSVSTAVTADTMWRLDGTYRLNGEKKLNAKIVRSEL